MELSFTKALKERNPFIKFILMKIKIDIPEWQQREVSKRIVAIKKGEMEVEKWEDVKEEILGKKQS
jgi:hypothetical protein